MFDITSAHAKALLDHSLGLISTPLTPALFLGLSTTNPTKAGLFSGEVSTIGTGYARQSLVGKMRVTDEASGISSLNGVVTFGSPTANWHATPYGFIAKSEAGVAAGDMLYFGQWSVIFEIVNGGRPLVLSPGQVSVRVR